MNASVTTPVSIPAMMAGYGCYTAPKTEHPAFTAERVTKLVESTTKKNRSAGAPSIESRVRAVDWVANLVRKDTRLNDTDRKARLNQLESMRPHLEYQFDERLELAARRAEEGESDAIQKAFARCCNDSAGLVPARRTEIRNYLVQWVKAYWAETPDKVDALLSDLEGTHPTPTATPKPPMITLEAINGDFKRSKNTLELAERYLRHVLKETNRQVSPLELARFRQFVKDQVHDHFRAQALENRTDVLSASDEATRWLDAVEKRSEKPKFHKNNGGRPHQAREVIGSVAPRDPAYKTASGSHLTPAEIAARAKAKKVAREERADESAKRSREIDLAKLWTKDKRTPAKAEAESEANGKGGKRNKGGNNAKRNGNANTGNGKPQKGPRGK